MVARANRRIGRLRGTEDVPLFITIRGRIEEFRLRVPRPHKEGNFDVLDVLRDCGSCPILLEVYKIQGIYIASHGFPSPTGDIESFEVMFSRVESIRNLLGIVFLDLYITIRIYSKSDNTIIFNVRIIRIINGEFANCIWQFFDKTGLGISRWIVTSRPYLSGHSIYAGTDGLLYFYSIVLAII